MVTTPWYDYEIPMTQAAEMGTKKVMEEHCSIGLVVTTDGSITDIPRSDYEKAEEKAITDMIATGKPFLVIINSKEPHSEAARAVKDKLHSIYGVDAAVCDCQTLDTDALNHLLQRLLYAFPMQALHVHLPRWIGSLEADHPVKKVLYQSLLETAESITTIAGAEAAIENLKQLEQVVDCNLRSIDLGSGTISCAITLPEALFYEILSAKAGTTIENDGQLLSLLTTLSAAKKAYDKISDAISSVTASGYGIVMPGAEEMKLETPELLHKNGSYGVKLRAGAPSIHMIRVDIDTEITPMVGDEKQSQDLINYLSGESADTLWQSNIFGKSVYEMIQEGISAKLLRTPEDVRGKIRGTLTKIVNSGANGLICLIL